MITRRGFFRSCAAVAAAMLVPAAQAIGVVEQEEEVVDVDHYAISCNKGENVAKGFIRYSVNGDEWLTRQFVLKRPACRLQLTRRISINFSQFWS